MNELIFLSHIAIVSFFTWGASKKGKEGLFVWLTLEMLLANLFVLKQIDLFSLTVTASDAYAVGAFLTLNFIQDKYGKSEALNAINIAFFVQLFFIVLSQIHIAYEPSSVDSMQSAFKTLLTFTPRITIASVLVFYLSQRLDSALFGKFRTFHLSFPVASIGSNLIAQVLDTTLFSFMGLWGIAESISHVIVISLLIKGLLILILNPSTYFLRKKFA